MFPIEQQVPEKGTLQWYESMILAQPVPKIHCYQKRSFSPRRGDLKGDKERGMTKEEVSLFLFQTIEEIIEDLVKGKI